MVYVQVDSGGICMQASCVSYMHHIRRPRESRLRGALHQDPGFLALMMLCRIYKKPNITVQCLHTLHLPEYMWVSPECSVSKQRTIMSLYSSIISPLKSLLFSIGPQASVYPQSSTTNTTKLKNPPG